MAGECHEPFPTRVSSLAGPRPQAHKMAPRPDVGGTMKPR
jgi:hypothetical protein